ncbi:MAG: hypothetical protein ACP5HS_03495 [Anaerolineae bacterium]
MNQETAEQVKSETELRENTAESAPTGVAPRDRPKVTFRGNSYDLTALGAFASGIVVLLTCLTCGQFAYCLPAVPLVLGIIGLVMAGQSVDEERTKRWSWLGIGGGAFVALLAAAAILGYFVFVVFLVLLSNIQ